MTIRSYSALLAFLVVAIPAVDAGAQSSPSSGPISPGPQNANDNPGVASNKRPTADDSHVRGATGDAIVPGDQSTVAGDRGATAEQRTGNK